MVINMSLQQIIESFKTAVSAIPNPPPEEIADTVLDVINDPSKEENNALWLLHDLCLWYGIPLIDLNTFSEMIVLAEKHGATDIIETVKDHIEKRAIGLFIPIRINGQKHIVSIADELFKLEPGYGHELADTVIHEFYHYLLRLSRPPLPIGELEDKFNQFFHPFSEKVADIRGDIVMNSVLKFLREEGLIA